MLRVALTRPPRGGNDDDLAIEAGPRAARGERWIALQRKVDDAPVARTHRVQGDRLAAATRTLGNALRQRFEGLASAQAIVFQIDHQPADRLVLVGHDAIDHALERVERLR